MARNKKAEGTPRLDFPEGSAGKLRLLLYTTSNNLRHYLSMDSVIGRAHFEAPHHDRALGTLWDAGLLIVPESVPGQSLASFKDGWRASGSTAVVCAFRPGMCSAVPVQFVTRTGTIEDGTLAGFDARRHQAAAVLGYVPIGWVDSLVFEHEEHLERFLFSSISNVAVPRGKCRVDPALFNGSHEIDVASLEHTCRGLNQPTVEVVQALTRRGRLRAAMVGAFESSGLDVGPAVRLFADASLVQVLHALSETPCPDDIHACVEVAILSLEAAVNETVVPMVLKRPPIQREDVFPAFGRLGPVVGSDDWVGVVRKAFARDLHATTSGDFVDRMAYALAVSRLVSRGLEGNSIGDLTTDVVAQLELLLSEAQASEAGQETGSAILERYRNASRRIGELADGIGPGLPDLLRRWPSNFSTLKALAILATVHGIDEFSTLKRKLELMPEARQDQRVIWSLFGARHGMAGLGAEYKGDREFLDLSEAVTSRWLPDPRLVRVGAGAVSPMGDVSETHEAADGSIERVVLFSIGPGLRAPAGRVGDCLGRLRDFTLDLLSSEEGENTLQTLLMSNEPKADDYCCVSGETTGIVIRTDEETKRILYEAKGRQFEVRWANWAKFRRTFLESQRRFRSLSSDSIAALAEMYQTRNLINEGPGLSPSIREV